MGEDLVRESSVLRHDARIEPLFEGVLSQVAHQGEGEEAARVIVTVEDGERHVSERVGHRREDEQARS